MLMKVLLSGVWLAVLASCGNSSGGGEVKVFNTRAEFAQAMREGKIKQGDKVAVREGNLDDVPGMTKR
jgi:dihydroxyacid dehydratase/phosphogluconate dehydratase